MIFKEMILAIKIGGQRLFIAVEKEVGKYKQSVFLLMKPTKRAEARVWLKENLEKDFKFVHNKERNCSVPISQINKEDKQCKTQTSDYIRSIMEIQQAQEHNNFKTKYPSYVEAVKAGAEEHKNIQKENKQNEQQANINKQVQINNNDQVLPQEFMTQMMSQIVQFMKSITVLSETILVICKI